MRLKRIVLGTTLVAILVWVGVGILWLQSRNNYQTGVLPLGTSVVDGVTIQVVRPHELLKELKTSSSDSSSQRVVLDLRNLSDYQESHFPGAIHWDPATENQVEDLLPYQEVFLYTDENFLEPTNWQLETVPLIVEKLRAAGVKRIKVINQPYVQWKDKMEG